MYPTSLIVPTKGSHGLLLMKLLDDLRHDVQLFVIIDTGMPKDLRTSIERKSKLGERLVFLDDRVTDVDTDVNIHRWWNRGIRYTWETWHDEHDKWNLLITNDDIEVGKDYVIELESALRGHDDVGVAGARQTRAVPRARIFETDRIDAGSNDNRGLSGWAFMLRGEDEYVFDERFQWWFGDNDLIESMRHAGKKIMVTHATWAVHHGDGRFSADMAPMVSRDQAWFKAKWGVRL